MTTWPNIAVHAHVLPTGQVLWWPPFSDGDNPTLWNPSTNTNTPATRAGANIFCSGHAFLANGQLFVAGGHVSNWVGLSSAYAYNPTTNTWTQLPDMNNGRWYPTSTTLPNGDMLVVSGWINSLAGVNIEPQVWQTATASWRNLSTAHLALPFYPFMFVAPNGKVFCAGPSQLTRYLDVSNAGGWSSVASNIYGDRNWASSVMYDDGKVLVMGGSTCDPYPGASCTTLPTATAETIDLTSSTPAWKSTGSMTFGRRLHNATLLPDGKVLVTGGTRGSEDPNTNSTNPALAAEMWDPATGTWSTMASLTVFRGYHSIALLLPDGRVLSGGGQTVSPPAAEIYSPPYLFQGSRPTIVAAPTSIAYGQSFFVATPDATSISKVTMLALGSVTHNFNMGQRICRLSFSQASGGLNVTAPSSGNTAPPGYYMLFILNSTGVPSVAQVVQITGGNPAPTPTPAPTATPIPAAPSNLAATAASSSQINLSWTDNSTNETGFYIERSTNGTTFTQIATVGANVTTYSSGGLAAATKYYYRVRAYNSGGNSAYSSTASATTLPLPPAAPTNLTATVTSTTQVDLSWTDNSNNETGFKIERSTNGTTFTEIATVGAGVTAYSDNGLTPSTTYYYRVRAYNSSGNSSYSNIGNITTAAPAAPTNLTGAAASSTSIDLSWIDSSNNESRFKIERSDDGVTFSEIATAGTNVTRYTDTGLTPLMAYTYRVRASNVIGDSIYSKSVTVRLVPPDAPTNLAASVAINGRVTLTWSDNSNNETGFQVERSTDGSTFAVIATTAANATEYYDSRAAKRQIYYYRVCGKNNVGLSAYTNVVKTVP